MPTGRFLSEEAQRRMKEDYLEDPDNQISFGVVRCCLFGGISKIDDIRQCEQRIRACEQLDDCECTDTEQP